MSEEYKPFPEREGDTEPKPVQWKSIDGNLRVGLWNLFSQIICDNNQVRRSILKHIWTYFVIEPEDEFDLWVCDGAVKNIFLKEDWIRVYALIEFIVRCEIYHYNQYGICEFHVRRGKFLEQCNTLLEKENSAYRIINRLVTPITNEQEIESIKEACNILYEGARKHIEQSLALFSDREKPDYLNSIKEAISAVESLAKEITGEEKDTLGKLTQRLPLQHTAFKTALSNLYGFRGDTPIAHGSKPGEYLPIDQGTARFMLVICSAFINYIISQQPESTKNKPRKGNA